MKPARFSYAAPTSLSEALDILASEDDARVIAGGQSLVPMMNMRLAQPEWLVDINGLAELSGVRQNGDMLVVGALTRHADLAADRLVRQHCPVLAHAAGTIGHYAIRQRGTFGGSLAHADPAAQLPLACVLLDARIEAMSSHGRRMIEASAFFEAVFTTVLEPDELVTAIHLPVMRVGEMWGFRLFSRRAGDFSEASAAATLARNAHGSVLRLALGAVASIPVRAEELVSTIEPDDDGWAARAAAEVAAAAEVEENARIPVEYRREVLQALVEDVLRDVAGRA